MDDAAVKVGADEGEEEDGGEQCPGFCAAQLFDAGLVQERADLEIVEKCGDAVANLPCIFCCLRKKSVVIMGAFSFRYC